MPQMSSSSSSRSNQERQHNGSNSSSPVCSTVIPPSTQVRAGSATSHRLASRTHREVIVREADPLELALGGGGHSHHAARDRAERAQVDQRVHQPLVRCADTQTDRTSDRRETRGEGNQKKREEKKGEEKGSGAQRERQTERQTDRETERGITSQTSSSTEPLAARVACLTRTHLDTRWSV